MRARYAFAAVASLLLLAAPLAAQICQEDPPLRIEKGPYRTRGFELTSGEMDDWLRNVRAMCEAPGPTAAEVPISDAGSFYAGTDVEAMGQEIGALLQNWQPPYSHPSDPGPCTVADAVRIWQKGAVRYLTKCDGAAFTAWLPAHSESHLVGGDDELGAEDLVTFCGAGVPIVGVGDNTLACAAAAASLAGHAHAAADTTSGTFADARISASSVTQHETALEAVLDLADQQGTLPPAKLSAVDSPADEECYTYESTGTTGEWQACGGGGGTPGGADTQVQYNDGGAFGGDSGLTFNETTDALTVGGRVLIPDGALATPALSFSADLDTGCNRASANDWYCVADGSATWTLWQLDGNGGAGNGRMRLYNSDNSGWLEVGNGGNQPLISFNGTGVLANAYGWNGDANTGLRWAGADNPRIQAGGVDALSVTTAGATVNNILSITPQATAPATCVAATDIYTDTSGALCFCTAADTWTNVSGVGSCA